MKYRFLNYLLVLALAVSFSGVNAAKLTDQPSLAVPAPADVLHVVDVSDTSSGPAGTSKKATLESLGGIFLATKSVLINSLSDFPTPVTGVITLAAETEYVIGGDVNLGTNRLVMSANTALSGIESIVVTLTYTGTGDMITILNTRNRVNNLSISAVNGRIINFSDNTDTIFRMNDVSVTCATFGLFNSSGTNGSTVRFTAVSPSSITVGGVTTTGSWNTWLWETSAVNITSGALFDFGTATFDAIILDLILADLGAGTTLIDGLASSGNIKVGGIGAVTRMLTSGAGTPLTGVTVNDFRWVFRNNDDIQDTMPDAMASLQGNATETVIATINIPVKAAGTWVVERQSHYTVDTTGRITYIGEKDLTTPVDISLTIRSAGGTNKDVTVYLAFNGAIIANSARTATVGQNDPKSVGVIWQLTLSQTDFLELFVENNSDTVNLVVESAISRAR